MSTIHRYIAALATGLLVGATALTAAAEVAVVAARNSPMSSLTANQVIDIFLGKNSSLPGVGMVTPVDQVEGSAVREEFYRKAARKDPAQLKAYWSKQIFTGKGEPPPEARDTAAVKRAVTSNPHAIGYIQKSAVDESVKPLLILP